MNCKKSIFIISVAVIILAITLFISLCFGAVHFGFSDLYNAFFNANSIMGRILWVVRIPRVTAAIIAGAGLSVSGVILQTVLSNPLTAPSVIGVNSGAGLFTALCAVLFPSSISLFPPAAFIGAIISVLLVYGIAYKNGTSKITLILSGVAVSALMNAGINVLATIFPHLLNSIHDFQTGGFSGVSFRMIALPGFAILLCLLLTLLFSRELEILSLGEESARSLGLRIKIWRATFLIFAASLAGCAVSFGGLISFVGLIAPHMARLILSDSSKGIHIALSALAGAILLLLCDTVSRTLFTPYELPVGIFISFLGAPFFLWLIYRERRKRCA